MKHASSKTIEQLEPLLMKIRRINGLREKKPGVYYVKSKAFLHFHEEKGEIFADVRLTPPEFDRLPATTTQEQAILLEAIRKYQEST